MEKERILDHPDGGALAAILHCIIVATVPRIITVSPVFPGHRMSQPDLVVAKHSDPARLVTTLATYNLDLTPGH